MPTGTNTTNYQFFKPDDNQPGWGSAMRNFIDIVDRDLWRAISFINNFESFMGNLEARLISIERNAADLGAEVDSNYADLVARLNAHLNKATGAHAASAISETRTGDVQTALDNLNSRLLIVEAALRTLQQGNTGTVNTGSLAASFTALNGVTAGVVNFAATATPTPGAVVTAYNWDFGDNSTGSGQNVSHTYPSAGPFTANLTVRDSAGGLKVISKTVTPPLAANSGDLAVSFTYPSNLTLNGGDIASVVTGGTGPYTYKWTLDTYMNGMYALNGTQSTVYTYTTQNIHSTPWPYSILVTLVVTDSAGKSSTYTKVIAGYSVDHPNTPPATPTYVHNLMYDLQAGGKFKARMVYAAAGSLGNDTPPPATTGNEPGYKKVVFDYGDGQSDTITFSTGAQWRADAPVHQYSAPGNYNVQATTTWADDTVAVTSTLVNIIPTCRITLSSADTANPMVGSTNPQVNNMGSRTTYPVTITGSEWWGATSMPISLGHTGSDASKFNPGMTTVMAPAITLYQDSPTTVQLTNLVMPTDSQTGTSREVVFTINPPMQVGAAVYGLAMTYGSAVLRFNR